MAGDLYLFGMAAAEPAPIKVECGIAKAIATEGGYLAIGQGGATLYFDRGRLSGCHPEQVKVAAIAAGLPVIDSRNVPFEVLWTLLCAGR